MSDETSIFSKEYRARKLGKEKPTKKTRKPIRPMSKKLSGDRKTYRELRADFLSRPENMFCAVFPSIPAETIHHKKGRIGKLLNDTTHWIALSLVGHQWVEDNPDLAKERGFSESRLELVTPLNEK